MFARRPTVAYALALAIAAGACGLRTLLDPWFPPGFAYPTFFPAIVFSAFLFGLGPGVATAVACGAFAKYAYIPPIHSFRLSSGSVSLLFYAMAASVGVLAIHLMQRANARLQAERERTRRLLEERGRLLERSDLLFRELQHRVSNNLQMIGALLSLQRRAVSDPGARRALAEASERLNIIGRIQRTLYDASGELSDLEPFLCKLVSDLLASAGKPGVKHRIESASNVRLPANAAIPVALVVAEAVANAIEHGFADRNEGAIHVAVARRADWVDVSVRDDGRGLPDGFDAETTNSLGLRIVRTLAKQIGGRFAVEPALPGARLTLSLPMSGEF